MVQGSDRLTALSEYFFSQKQKEISRMRKEGKDVINLGMGNPDLPPHPEVVKALKSSADNPGSHGYQPYRGTPKLKEAISEWMKREFSVSCNPEKEVLPLIGSKEGIFHTSMAFLNPGDKVLVPELGYPAYRAISKMVGAEIITYPLDSGYQPDWDHWPEEARQAKIMWMNYPHMPTGASTSVETLKKAVQFGIRSNTLICHDNPYSHILNQERLSILTVEGSSQHALELHSLSKSHNMAGWRVGWVCGHNDYIDKIVKIKSNIDSGMFRGIQDAAVRALELGDTWFAELNQVYENRQRLAISLLKHLDCQFNDEQSGLFLWGQLPKGQDSMEWSKEILNRHHIFITPGVIFGEKGKDYIRISLCVNEDLLKEAIKRLGS